MLDCKVDVLNKSDPILIEDVLKEFNRFYYKDMHHVYNKLLMHFLDMLKRNLVKSSDGSVLDEGSPAVQELMGLEEVKFCQIDQGLFEYLYDVICHIDDQDEESKKDDE